MGNAVYYVVQTRGEAGPTATPTSLPTPTTHTSKRPVEEEQGEDGTLLRVEARQQPPEYSSCSYNCQRRGEANDTIRNHGPSAPSSSSSAAASSSVPSSAAQEVTERSD
ncbi:hypothetical protein QOT17_016677, partial [Balamuthia mandrillaris]